MSRIDPYSLAIAQMDGALLSHPDQKNEACKSQIEKLAKLTYLPPFMASMSAFPLKMVVTHEFFFGNLIMEPKYNNLRDWLKVAVKIPGDETDQLAKLCVERNFYMTSCAIEFDPEWPERVWNTAYIIDPSGKIILKYRKINTLNTTGIDPICSVGSVYSEYVKKYGREKVFPVVDTPIGKLACLICYDVNFPEVARCLALNGAEVLLHPTSDAFPHVKAARAYENTAFFACSNIARNGESQLVDFRGEFLIPPTQPGVRLYRKNVDIYMLRRTRSEMMSHNFLSQLKSGVYAPQYSEKEIVPVDCFAKPQQSNEEGTKIYAGIYDSLYKRRIFEKAE